MPEQNWSKEPWAIHSSVFDWITLPTDTGRKSHWQAPGDTYEECEANARRIIACVNACAGIPTEALEADILSKLFAFLQTFEIDWDCGCDLDDDADSHTQEGCPGYQLQTILICLGLWGAPPISTLSQLQQPEAQS